jgi:Right handed beta helix region
LAANAWSAKSSNASCQRFDPRQPKLGKPLSFVFLILLIALGFTWGCGGGIGAAVPKALASTTDFSSSANNATTSAPSNSSTSGSTTNSPSTPPAPTAPVAPSNAVSLLHFGNAGFGGDDTNVFQAALNYTAANGQTLEIPAGNYNINPITFPANSNVFVDAGVTVTANSGYNTGQVMLGIHSSNVTITGADATLSVFHMRKAEYTSGESRHCLVIQNASNVTVSGISCNDSGGDGLYVRASTNVTVQDSIFNNNRRQGSSVTGQVNHIYYYRDHFTNTNGTAPQAGIDIEPNAPSDFLLDVKIEDCYTDANAGDGIMVSTWLMDPTSKPIDVTVLRNHATGNGRFGYSGQNNDPSNAPGTILIQDSFSDQSGSYGAAGYFYEGNGAALIFKNLTVTNPHMAGPTVYGDNAAVGVARSSGYTVPQGNVHFLNINIAITNGRSDRYFNFQDGSGMTATNVEFVPATLSGATNVPPLGLDQGAGMNSIP